MRRLGFALLAVLALGGCSLPLPGEVHPVGEVPAEERAGGALQVIPPGPKPGATPVETVLGFLGAQASSEGRHAVARQFLAQGERQRWRDDLDVQVYDPDRLSLRQVPTGVEGLAQVQVVSHVSAVVRADGSYATRPGVRVVEDYHLVRVGGQWLLDDVPAGLRLTAADRQRAFTPWPVFYLAPPSRDDDAPHLVPDLVFLPAGPDPARSLVLRLLRPPSQALAGSVTTAVPVGARLRQVLTSPGGVVTVDLTGLRAGPKGHAAQDLSAQLVWTLRSLGTSFRGLRLLVDGQSLPVPGEDAVQGAGAWGAYDPQGLGPAPPYFYTSSRRLRASVELPASPATAGDVGDARAVPVDVVAVTTDRTRVALVDSLGPGPDTVRVGPLNGTAFPVVARGGSLTSPTWGSGQHGLWLVRDEREVVRVDDRLRRVAVHGLPRGRLSSMAVSRDGARVALVVAGRLYVGRVELGPEGPRVVGLALVLPGLHDATRVTWASSTELVVLGVVRRASQLLRVAADGSSVLALSTAGLAASDVTASPAGLVLLAAGRLYESSNGAFRPVQVGKPSAPAFPG